MISLLLLLGGWVDLGVSGRRSLERPGGERTHGLHPARPVRESPSRQAEGLLDALCLYGHPEAGRSAVYLYAHLDHGLYLSFRFSRGVDRCLSPVHVISPTIRGSCVALRASGAHRVSP